MTSICGRQTSDGTPCQRPAGCRIAHKPKQHSTKTPHLTATTAATSYDPTPDNPISHLIRPPVEVLAEEANLARRQVLVCHPPRPEQEPPDISNYTAHLCSSADQIKASFEDAPLAFLIPPPEKARFLDWREPDHDLADVLHQKALTMLTEPNHDTDVARDRSSDHRFSDQVCWRATTLLTVSLRARNVCAAVAFSRATEAVKDCNAVYQEFKGHAPVLTSDEAAMRWQDEHVPRMVGCFSEAVCRSYDDCSEPMGHDMWVRLITLARSHD